MKVQRLTVETMSEVIEYFKELYKKPRNWEEIAKEIEAIVLPLDEYVLTPVEYNTDTSARHSYE